MIPIVPIPSLLKRPELWRCMGFVSSATGLICYALSFPSKHIFGEWNFLKIFLYTLLSFIMCSMVLYAKKWQLSRSLMLKAHLGFLVLMLTSVYSFFHDKAVNGKPDTLGLISCVAFAMMSFSLSRQIDLGFEVDLLNFFLGCLTIQLMKINLLLALVGAAFCYILIVLRSSLDSHQHAGTSGGTAVDHVAIDIDAATRLQRVADRDNNSGIQSEDRNAGPVSQSLRRRRADGIADEAQTSSEYLYRAFRKQRILAEKVERESLYKHNQDTKIQDGTGLYKNLLQETAHRAGLNLPVYTTIQSGPDHVPSFSCTVEIAGIYFAGDPARTKKQAQKNGAMAAWSALRKLSEHHLSSSASSACPSDSKSEEIIIAQVLASLHRFESKNILENDNQLRWQKSTTTSLVSTKPTPGMYPIVQSVLQPDHCVYFPARELASVPAGPKFPVATSRPSFYLSNQIVPELSRGRSAVTIREVQGEKAEDPPACDSSNETRLVTLASEDERQKHGGSGSRSRTAELGGEQSGKFVRTSHRSMGTVHRPVNIELQNPSGIENSDLRAHSEASSNSSFRPPAAASSIVRTMGPTSSVCSTPQHGGKDEKWSSPKVSRHGHL